MNSLPPVVSIMLSAWLVSGFNSVVVAEYPGLESAIQADLKPFVADLAGKSVLVSLPDPIELNRQWRLTAAIETEIVAQLLQAGIVAIDEDDDERFVWLAKSKNKSISRWQEFPVYDILVTGELKLNKSAKELELHLIAYGNNSPDPVSEMTTVIRASDADVMANIPLRNGSVTQFIRSKRGLTIGKGICATAATEALKHAGCERFGLYDWGRRLGKNEALLPGDIVQFEYAKFAPKKGKRFTLVHHTAIIHEIVDADAFKVLHQNVGNARIKKTVTEGTFSMSALKSGTVVFFRPTIAENVLPVDPTPFRKGPATVKRDKGGRIDLKRTIDPELDSVHGIWGIWNNAICSHKDKFLKLQIPVEVPESYIIRARIKRTWGNDTYAMILVVGGHQCLLGLDAYGGTKSGLELIAGRKLKDNLTTHEITNILPLNKPVDVIVKVTPTSVHVDVDGHEIVDWSGDPSVFSLQEKWQVPNKSWLHLGTYWSVFDTESLTLEVID